MGSGKSDPFITLAFSEFGKPVYCTRIIEQELDPSWNEQTCLLVYQDQLTSGEKLSVELWDSDTVGKDDRVPAEIRDRPEFQDDKGTVTTDQEVGVTTTPPDPTLPSGICSILIHQIENLEVERPSGSFGSYQPWTPAQITGENTDEEGDALPSSYCTVLQDDELVFRTRTKVHSSNPIFNAQTERFVRDWRNAIFTITCRNSLNREHDPILGCIT